MKYLSESVLLFILFLACFSCSSTKQLKISFTEPSPVDLSNHIRKIGIVNSSKANGEKSYANGLEQLIVMEERWLAEKGTEAALTGLFDELAEDTRFDTVKILDKIPNNTMDFGDNPDNDTWQKITMICKENGVDALFSLASHKMETEFSFKKTKLDQIDMMRERIKVTGQEITLETLIENGWRIYDPKQGILIDAFTTNEQLKSSAKGINAIAALQSIDNRRENLLKQSKQLGSSYGNRIQPRELSVYRDYYSTGSHKMELADKKIEGGFYSEANKLWKQEITNPKTKISSRACYNLAVLSEFNGDLNNALKWAVKSYALDNAKDTESYIKELEYRQTYTTVHSNGVATTEFLD